jgi:hydroxymethylpyrimidine pyrophosphatase-like HAD family hydrolase
MQAAKLFYVRAEDQAAPFPFWRSLVWKVPLSRITGRPMLQYVRQANIQFDVCTAFDMYIEGLGDYEDMYNKFMANPNILPDVTELKLPIVKFSLLSQPDVLDRVEREWNDQKLFGKLKMIRSGDVFIDVMNPAANKGNALKALADSWHIDAGQVMAVGNYYNDLEMMSFAGLGLAVENSPEGVKAAADGIVASNNDDGVYEAIAKYCL